MVLYRLQIVLQTVFCVIILQACAGILVFTHRLCALACQEYYQQQKTVFYVEFRAKTGAKLHRRSKPKIVFIARMFNLDDSE